MDKLFSCRNCIHNPAQSLLIGRGAGFCLIHQSVLKQPERTTCKYLARKDMPSFVVDEGIKEHAYEFAMFSAIADMPTMSPVNRVHYSEKHAWMTQEFDALTQNLAQSHRIRPAWVFVQNLAGGVDGRRSLVHASLVRRHMAKSGTWRSSYRFVLTLVQELPSTPRFEADDLVEAGNGDPGGEAGWDVFFARISGVQEYGFHAGLEQLMWATDHLNGPLTDFDWEKLRQELLRKSLEWTELIIGHAQDEGCFFPEHQGADEFEDLESP